MFLGSFLAVRLPSVFGEFEGVEIGGRRTPLGVCSLEGLKKKGRRNRMLVKMKGEG
jgi:hypothetical protein